MRITLSQSNDRYEIYTITVDDEPWRDVHLSIFGKKIQIKADSPKDLEEQFNALELKLTRNYVLKKIASKNHSSFELKKILKEKLVSSQTITFVVNEMIQLGYINDYEWILSFIRSQKSKKKGPRAIIQKLKAKQVPLEQIEALRDEIDDRMDQIQGIEKFIKKYRVLTDPKIKQKAIQALIRKGFSIEIIKEIIN